MAQKRIERSDLVSPDAITPVIGELVELEAQLTKIVNINKVLLKTNPLKTGADAKKLNEDIQSVNASTEALSKTTKKLNEQTDAQVQEKIKLQRAAQDQKKSLQDELILTDKQSGTLEKLAASSRKLRREREKLNLDTEKGRKRLEEINTQLDKNNAKLKANSDQLKKQKLNVGNYTNSIKDAVGEMGLFGGVIAKTTQVQRALTSIQTAYNTALTGTVTRLQAVKVALLSTGIGAFIVILGSLVAAFQSSEEGQDKLEKGLKSIGVVIGNVSDVFAAFGEQIVSFLSGKGFDVTKIKQAVDDLINKTGEEIRESIRLSELIAETNRLERELLVENAEIQSKISDLRLKSRKEEKFSASQRKKFLMEANELQDTLISKELLIAKNRAEEIRIRNTFSKSTRENKEEEAAAEAKVFDIERKRKDQQRQIQRELNRVSGQERKELADQGKARLAANEALEKELELKEAIKNISPIESKKAETTEIKKQAKAQGELATNLEATEKATEAQDNAVDNKIKKEADLRAERDAAIDEAVKGTQFLAKTFEEASSVKIKALDDELRKEESNITRQERRAEQGLSNTLAINEKRAAELERQRQEEAEKSEKRQKVLAYLSQFTELSKSDPNSAALKAAANVAIAETVSGLFFEGAENIDDKTAHKWRNTGRDDFIIGVHGGERVMTATQNNKIGDISNEDLAEIAYQHRTGNIRSVHPINDDRIVSRLESLERTVKNNRVEFIIDRDGIVTEKRLEAGMKKIVKSKRPRIK